MDLWERSAKYAPGDIDAAFPHIYTPINLVGMGTRFSGAVHQEEETLLDRSVCLSLLLRSSAWLQFGCTASTVPPYGAATVPPR